MAESGDQLPVHRISAPEPWRVLRAKRWAGERDIVMPRSELVGAGVVTSASGVTSYRGAAYPEPYRGNVFVCECAGNLFYRLKLTPEGPTFKATRVVGDREMVASTDNWFRPVNFINAPDGTLHVLDMYRENIEHPWSIPDDIHAAVDLEAGRDMGRIWRLAPANFKVPPGPKLGSASTAELVVALKNPNSWWRETAQRLLYERQDKSAASALRDLLNGGDDHPQATVHALWALDGLRELTSADVVKALRTRAVGLRENALKLAEPRLKESAELRDAVMNLAHSEQDKAVTLQAAFTLGEIDDARALDALATIARRDAADPWIRTAILSSTAKSADQLLERLLADPNFAGNDLIHELAQVVGARGIPAEMSRVVSAVASRSGLSGDVLAGLGDGFKRSGRSLRKAGLDDAAARVVGQALDDAGRTAADAAAPEAARVAAIQLLANDEFDRVQTTLAQLLDKTQPQEVQRAAVAAAATFNRAETAPLLLTHWDTFTPAIRADVVVAMLGNRLRVPALLAAIERGEIPANQVPFARRAVLLRSTDPKVKELAARLFGDGSSGSRKAVIEKYQPALALRGDAAQGRKVFETACAVCHRAGDLGNDVGPNLATIRQWNPGQVLINILDPNREVAPNFVSYLVETKDGRTLDGMIAEESAASLTLKRAGGVQETVLRRDIAQMTGSKMSLMPEGLEAAVNVEQMADLIAFLLGDPTSAASSQRGPNDPK
jgi:putative heme-binding domain-containing protein